MLYATSFQHQARPLLQQLRPDAVYERYSLLGTAGNELARELKIPHILEVNAPLSEEHARHRGSAFAQTIRAAERRILAAADQVISVSEPLKQWIVGMGINADRVTVVPNGVNLKRFNTPAGDVRSRLGLDDRPVVGFVGTLKSWHGTAALIRAIGLMARERGADNAPHLLIVGDGPQRERLEEVAREDSITDLTTFTGMVPHDEMISYITAMDIAIAPYDAMPDFYFSPLKLFEYMAAGRPIIAAGIGQIEECIRDGETGLLYPPGDIPALARTIGHLLDDPERARALGHAALAEARTHRSWDRNARIVTALVELEQVHRTRASIEIAQTVGGN